MLSQRIGNIVFAIVLLAACLFFGNAAMKFDDLSLPGSTQLSSRFFPIVMLLFIAFCTVIVLIQYILDKGVGLRSEENVFPTPMAAVHGFLTLAAVVASYLIWGAYGFIPAALFIGPAAALAMGVRNPIIYIVLVALSVLIYLAFTQLLNIQL